MMEGNIHTATGKLFCCDWGTTTFRLKCVDMATLQVLGDLNRVEGVSKTFQAWKHQHRMDGIGRSDFFLSEVKRYIGMLCEEAGIDSEGLPIVISGMASSSIGIMELPYAELPFAVNGSAASVQVIEKCAKFPHDVLIVSGVRSEVDVMRGEEAQLVGLVHLEKEAGRMLTDGTFIFPGTHSKHIYVKESSIVNFKTFMTGELFHILGNHSLLRESIAEADPTKLVGANREAFSRGLQAAASQLLLHSLFMVRTNRLFEKMSPEENYFYLSGLLIGSELSSITRIYEAPLVICAAPNLAPQYQVAVEELRFPAPSFVESSIAEKTALAGQIQIYKRHTATPAI